MSLPDYEITDLPGPFESARALWDYTIEEFHSTAPVGRKIRVIKTDGHKNQQEYINLFADRVVGWLKMNTPFPTPDCIVTIPDTEQNRLVKPVDTMAAQIAEKMNWHFEKSVIELSRLEKPQKTRGWTERLQDKTPRYRLNNSCNISGKHILLFDDVFATGQSMIEVGKLIQAQKPKSLTALALVRIIPG